MVERERKMKEGDDREGPQFRLGQSCRHIPRTPTRLSWTDTKAQRGSHQKQQNKRQRQSSDDEDGAQQKHVWENTTNSPPALSSSSSSSSKRRKRRGRKKREKVRGNEKRNETKQSSLLFVLLCFCLLDKKLLFTFVGEVKRW